MRVFVGAYWWMPAENASVPGSGAQVFHDRSEPPHQLAVAAQVVVGPKSGQYVASGEAGGGVSRYLPDVWAVASNLPGNLCCSRRAQDDHHGHAVAPAVVANPAAASAGSVGTRSASFLAARDAVSRAAGTSAMRAE